MSGLKILLIGAYPLQPGKVVGGVEAVTSTLSSALATLEDVAELTVLCFHRSIVRPHHRKVSSKLQVVYLRGQKRFALPTRSILERFQARHLASEILPDIVHGQGIGPSGYVATCLNRNSVVTVHGLIQVEARMAARGQLGSLRVRMVDGRVRDVLQRAGVVISTSNYDARSLDGVVRGLRVSIPNPVPYEFFQQVSYEATPPSILYAGMLVSRKNVTGLLRAFALVHRQVPEARLVIVGPMPDRAYLTEVKTLAAALCLDQVVDFKGFVETPVLLRQLRQARVLAMFSHEETSPTILAQALAASKPVVASNVGGIPELVSDGENGFLVEPGDEVALADRLTTLVNSPDLCRAFSLHGHAFACQRFEPSAVARQTLQAYRVLLEN